MSFGYFIIVGETERSIIVPEPVEVELCKQDSDLGGILPIPEPERELHERTRDFRERLKELCKNRVHPTSPVPFPNMGDADPLVRRTVHQRSSDGFIGARSLISRPTVPNANTWQDLKAKFLKKYYPPSRAAHLRDQIHSFRMDPDEPYHMAWERFSALLSRCPQHGFSDWAIMEKFYNGLTFEKQQMFNIAARGHIMDKLEPAECEEMFESFALAEQQRPSTRTSIPSARAPTFSPRGVHQVNPDTSVAAALAAMANEVKELKLSAQRWYSNYNNSFGSGWRFGSNLPRFNARSNQYGGGEAEASSGSSARDKKIEEMLENQTQMLAHLVQNDKETQQRLDAHDTLLKNQQSTFMDLQRTVVDIAKSLKEKQGEASAAYKSSNASVMAVSIRSRRIEEEEEVVETVTDTLIPTIDEVSHSTVRHIPSQEEVRKIDWRAHFAEIEARMVEEPPVEEEDTNLSHPNRRRNTSGQDM
ncbi:hypothetical protein L1987_15741 [Smallanthus sonchifolius]|uniref:Uncharacterized protein n=1 Tax=Smallanthus sonchifolius TaxID=185202 RepID=A0ACB9J8J1_9ASTR|nr:hypothetical protein L1987_15741 [Smallanthus sonchifolius]